MSELRTSHKLGALRGLPARIQEVERATGKPVTITWPLITLGPMPEHTQKLYATLNVAIRFV